MNAWIKYNLDNTFAAIMKGDCIVICFIMPIMTYNNIKLVQPWMPIKQYHGVVLFTYWWFFPLVSYTLQYHWRFVTLSELYSTHLMLLFSHCYHSRFPLTCYFLRFSHASLFPLFLLRKSAEANLSFNTFCFHSVKKLHLW